MSGVNMPSKTGRTTEYEMSVSVLRYLLNHARGEASQEELREPIPNYIDLTDGDTEDSTTRPGEKLWEQIVRNILSHKANKKNFVNQGYLKPVREGGLRITEEGRDFIRNLDDT